MLFIEKIPKDERAIFEKKLRFYSSKLMIDPEWLMIVMNAESGLSPSIQNSQTKATGLIQFMPDTARKLNTSIDDLKKLAATEQLRYVYEYLRPYVGRMKSYFDVYSAVFFPLVIGREDSFVLQTSKLKADTIARQNPAVNRNKDNVITAGEMKEYFKSKVPQSERERILNILSPKFNAGIMIGLLFLLFIFLAGRIKLKRR